RPSPRWRRCRRGPGRAPRRRLDRGLLGPPLERRRARHRAPAHLPGGAPRALMRPDVWAPRPERVELVLADGSRTPLTRRDGGWWTGGPDLAHATRYGFALDGGDPLPDP